LKLKNFQITICVCIFLTSLYIIDKSSSENSADSANIIIGISNVDSNSCLECQPGSDFFNSGCKNCIQDSINFRTKTALDQPFISSWSNDNSMLYGDSVCDGGMIIPSIKAESNKKYWAELHVKNSDFSVSIYDSSDYAEKITSATNSMCSIPSELKFLRFSMNDGKPISNGGRLVGNIDNIEIYDSKIQNNSKSKSIEDLQLVYAEDFSNCTTKTCDEKWVLQNPNLFYIDTEKNNFYFDSFISGTNDYANYELDNELSSEWIMRLLLSLDYVEQHPEGKGIFTIDPMYRNLFFILPSIILSVSVSILSFRIKSLRLGILILIFAALLLIVSIEPLISNPILQEKIVDERDIRIFVSIAVGIFLGSYGIWKIKSNVKNHLY